MPSTAPVSLEERLMLPLTLAASFGMAAAFFGTFVLPGIWLTAGLALVYLAAGLPTGLRALGALFKDHVLDIDLLMIIAALAALAVGAPLEGAVLLTLFSISGTLEHRAMGRARRAIEALMALRPETALRLSATGATEEIPVAALREGDLLVLRPGARVPVDGVLVTGEGTVDEATITGESMPVSKVPGAKLFEATVNLNSVLTMRASATVESSTVARMIDMVTEAQAARAPSETFSAWFGQRYTVAVLLGAMLAFVVLWGMGASASDALYRAAVLLVAASPCAVVISVPAAMLSALAAAARGGVLFKGGAALEALAEVKSFSFDKTGTLTTGVAEVTDLTSETPEGRMLALLSGLEAQSEHPIAAAIRRRAEAEGLAPAAIRDVVTHPSEGITGIDEEGPIWAGNQRMLERMGARVDTAGAQRLKASAQTVTWIGRGAQLIGGVTVADRPRPSSAAGLSQLRAAGVAQLALMTGDRRPVAERIGRELGFSDAEIHAELLPEDKVKLVAALAEKGRTAFVGDGVNDAAALARADVGVAMGVAGSEVALQAADVALLSEDMTRLAAARTLALRTRRIIRQNLGFALAMMVLLVVSALFFELPLPLAVIGHEGGTVLVVLNGLRLLADPIRNDRGAARKAASHPSSQPQEVSHV